MFTGLSSTSTSISSSTQRRDLVERAVQVVVRDAHGLEPALGRRRARLPPVARDVDPMAGVVPALDGLDRARVGLGSLDVVVGMGLLDHGDELVALQLADPPVVLLGVRQPHPVPLVRDPLEQIPVVVQRGVDVEGDPGHGWVPYVLLMKKVIPSPVRPAPLKAAAEAGDDYGVTDGPDWRSIDWLAELQQIEVLGTPVNYVDLGEQGDHRPIVFVHGLSGQWQNWLENIPRFAESRRVVAIDLPGFGLSPMPDEEISIEYYGRVVAELCDRLGLSPAVLVGNSMGGYIAAEVAIERPDVVERLLLVSAAGISQTDLARSPVARRRQGLRAARRPRTSRSCASSPRRPRLRPLDPVARRPPPEPPARRRAARGADEGHRQARLRAGPAGLRRLRLPRPAAADRLPDASSSGAARTRSSRSRTRTSSSSSSRARARSSSRTPATYRWSSARRPSTASCRSSSSTRSPRASSRRRAVSR